MKNVENLYNTIGYFTNNHLKYAVLYLYPTIINKICKKNCQLVILTISMWNQSSNFHLWIFWEERTLVTSSISFVKKKKKKKMINIHTPSISTNCKSVSMLNTVGVVNEWRKKCSQISCWRDKSQRTLKHNVSASLADGWRTFKIA